MVCVRQEFEIQAFFRAEVFVRGHALPTHTQDYGVAFGVLRLVHLKLVGFAGSTRGLIFGIEIKDDPLTAVGFEADRGTIL